MSKIKTTDSGTGWKHWRLLAVLGVVAAVMAPTIAAGAWVTYRGLSLKPRREKAWVTALAAGLAVAVLVAVGVSYGTSLGAVYGAILGRRPWEADAVVGVLLWGGAAGAIVGGLGWRLLLGWREADALRGRQRERERIEAEGRVMTGRAQRRQKAAYAPRGRWWTLPISEPRRVLALAAAVPEPKIPSVIVKKSPLPAHVRERSGFACGRVLEGDMPGYPVGSTFRLPRNGHLVLGGRTRMGKSELAFREMVDAIENGRQVVMINCKEPTSRATGPSARLAQWGEAHGRSVKVLAPVKGLQYDPMRGTPSQVRQRLMATEVFTEPHYEAACKLVLDLAITLAHQAGEPLHSVPDLVWSLASGRWRDLASVSPMAQQLAEMLGHKEVSGVVIRWAAKLVDLREWIAGRDAGGWSFEDADVIAVDLPTVTEPSASLSLIRAMLTDLNAYISDPLRRDMSREIQITLDEVSALDADPVTMRQVANLVERAGGAGGYVTSIVQGPSGLGDERIQEALLTNGTVATFQQATQNVVEAIASMGGSKEVAEASVQKSGMFSTGTGSERAQYAFSLAPDVIRRLGVGEMVVVDAGRYVRVATTMTASAYQGVTPRLDLTVKAREGRGEDLPEPRALPVEGMRPLFDVDQEPDERPYDIGDEV